MLEEAASEEDAVLRAAVLESQSKLLADESLDSDELAARTSTLMHAYAPGAEAAIAEAEANGTPPLFLAAQAILCGREAGE